VSRYSSLSALIAALASPVLYLMLDRIWWYTEGAVVLVLVVMSALLIWRHRSNIAKLIKGQESRIGAKSKA
jgi:glycerol-3-phosphate acyltransferase PlsY